ncbi:DUF839 domain-containing protein [Neisseriaceae bacterium PsAf]|nr:DUF839 domain-containing protein [Neisseriaceae bacterium PsAf]
MPLKNRKSLKHLNQDLILNNSDNPNIKDIIQKNISRRHFLQATTLASGLSLLPRFIFSKTLDNVQYMDRPKSLGFKSIPPAVEDTVNVPNGYTAKVLYSWGDPVGIKNQSPQFKKNAANSAREQALQAGMHHDGMDYFSLPMNTQSDSHALLAINHEYCDNGLLFPDGDNNWSLNKAKKAQNALGVSIIEIKKNSHQRWEVVRPSQYARRITAQTPVLLTGPAAGHRLMQTKQDNSGRMVLGTMQNCSNGKTPWGTYLTCEENWSDMFTNKTGRLSELEKRYGIKKKEKTYRWSEVDPRFETSNEPNEPNRFGWVVEIDPYNPNSTPKKHTALGRIKHESATVDIGNSQKVVVYTGDDEKFEYIYKLISKNNYQPQNRAANLKLLEEGTLYVAKFNDDNTGEWIPLVFGKSPLTPENGFKNQAEVLIKTRLAADKVGATKMDRPEWIAIDPKIRGSVYCTLTNNVLRGEQNKAGTDAANPRNNNIFGHIMHWQEDKHNPESLSFTWDIFAMGGLLNSTNTNWTTDIETVSFGSPDGLKFDHRGVMWVQTDVSTEILNQGPYNGVGNNQMFAVIPGSKEFKRFLTGPCGCEVTGIAFSPDNKAMFVNIQHPGETGEGISDPKAPRAVSSWPDAKTTGRPRSSTLIITKDDGGVIGS